MKNNKKSLFLLCSLAVQAAAVNVICELAGHEPKNYLSLVPICFRLLTTLNNNWVLTKIIKLVNIKLS